MKLNKVIEMLIEDPDKIFTIENQNKNEFKKTERFFITALEISDTALPSKQILMIDDAVNGPLKEHKQITISGIWINMYTKGYEYKEASDFEKEIILDDYSDLFKNGLGKEEVRIK